VALGYRPLGDRSGTETYVYQTMMSLIWIVFAGAAAIVGVRFRRRIAEARGGGHPRIDDEALRRIIEEGRLTMDEEEPLDLEEAARAEAEFWEEDWEEPEELGS
jgi:hypothetical protein